MILAIAPHTDDVVLGAGGYMAKLSERGVMTAVLALGTGRPEDGATEQEFKAAMRLLGVDATDLFDFEGNLYPTMRQEILDVIEEKIETLNPRILVIPARHDHQDHRTVYEESIRAARRSSISIIAYSHPWSQIISPFTPRLFVELEFFHVATKLQALAAFDSQMFRNYMDRDATIATAQHYGRSIGVDFSEAFEVVRWTM